MILEGLLLFIIAVIITGWISDHQEMKNKNGELQHEIKTESYWREYWYKEADRILDKNADVIGEMWQYKEKCDKKILESTDEINRKERVLKALQTEFARFRDYLTRLDKMYEEACDELGMVVKKHNNKNRSMNRKPK